MNLSQARVGLDMKHSPPLSHPPPPTNEHKLTLYKGWNLLDATKLFNI